MKYTDLPFDMPEVPLLELSGLPYTKVASGKVREVFDMGDAYLLVATDRVSAFDVIMKEGLAGKGCLLTQISLFWFEHVASLTVHHLVENHAERLEALCRVHPELANRSMIVKKLKPLPIEAVVRGYLAGSGWKSYEETGQLFEYSLADGLEESAELPEPLFTPTTKAASGHDLPIDCLDAAKLIGEELFDAVRSRSLDLYRMGASAARKAGILLADTKFEFGTDEAGRLYLIDEVLTPDSSRYWPLEGYAAGGPQPSYDKQFIRDYLEGLDWDKSPPPPPLPESVLSGTLERYVEAYRKLAL
jgi:phosphoribosylaminoimidazole-succinocarboxamide synthase